MTIKSFDLRKKTMLSLAIFLFVVCAFGCRVDKVSPPGTDVTGTPFWSIDFNTESPYQVYATLVATGAHCYIYLEDHQTVSQTAIDNIMNEFDSNIYPNDVAAFGNEPNPGIDNDPKTYILLSKFKEPNGPSYIAGFFYSLNEYVSDPTDTVNYPYTQYSNEKEMFYMNIDPAKGITPGDTNFYDVLAHEFQHMIHWEQKSHVQGLIEDTWLDEAMSEVARTYCGYGPSTDRRTLFELDPTHSLTIWDSELYNYGTVYMWSQYFRDRFDTNVFKNIMNVNDIGIASVNTALSNSYSTSFNNTFKDWSIALATGTTTTWFPYTSFTTTVVSIPNLTALSAQSAYSLGFYDYTTAGTGSITWTAIAPAEHATFIDRGSVTVHYDLVSGSTYSYTNTGLLITQNIDLSTSGGGTVAYSSLKYLSSVAAQSPARMLEKANQRLLMQNNPKPQSICIQPWLADQEATLRAKGAKPIFW